MRVPSHTLIIKFIDRYLQLLFIQIARQLKTWDFYDSINTPLSPMISQPFRTTPTKPPVWTASLPPPDSRHSISASPSNQLTRVWAGTSNVCNWSPRAVRISARARPWFVLIVLIVFRHDVTSLVDSSVVIISRMSEGWGAAMQL